MYSNPYVFQSFNYDIYLEINIFLFIITGKSYVCWEISNIVCYYTCTGYYYCLII
jgi:hypothetical protein